MKAIVTVGISCSGKSSFAAKMVEQHNYTEINRDWIRFNVVAPGSDWRTYKFTKVREKEVTDVADKLLMECWAAERNIVISDTNLNTGRRCALIQKLQDLGYDVEVKVFNVSYDEAVKRDNYRQNGVGQNVIYKQMQDFNDMSMRKTYEPNDSLEKAIIVDVDGTIAKMNGRGPFEWNRVGEDEPRWFVIDMVINYARQGYAIIIVSGRSDECKAETLEWLTYNGVPFKELHMRHEGDYRRDSVIKEEIFWTKLADRYNIEAAIDDRPMMIRTWYELKIPNVIAVDDPYNEF